MPRRFTVRIFMSLKIHRSALVMFSCQQMFDLVNDVVAYPQFLPWCSGAEVLGCDENVMMAMVQVSKGGVKQSFTTRNQLEAHEKISMSLVDGPFQSLKGDWCFTALRQDACKVELELHFELKPGIGKMAFGAVFNQAANTMVDAFCQRAKVVYG